MGACGCHIQLGCCQPLMLMAQSGLVGVTYCWVVVSLSCWWLSGGLWGSHPVGLLSASHAGGSVGACGVTSCWVVVSLSCWWLSRGLWGSHPVGLLSASHAGGTDYQLITVILH